MKQGQFPAVLLLGSLNGQNGFKLDGENNNDNSGISISAVGDINDDGHDDLIVGAYAYPEGSAKGRSYVVFASRAHCASCAGNLVRARRSQRFAESQQCAADQNQFQPK